MMEWHGMTHPAPDLLAIIIIVIITNTETAADAKKELCCLSFLFPSTTFSVFFSVEKASSFVSYESYW